VIFLHRSYPPDGGPVLGKLVLPDWECVTLERPWLQNKPNVSCIPEGTYELQMRRSPLLERITEGKYLTGWEVMNVPKRTFIMFHPGNWVQDTEGCILVGRKITWTDREGSMITSSRNTFHYFMKNMEQLEDHPLLTIQTMEAEWNSPSPASNT
jgi:hypothetical protein